MEITVFEDLKLEKYTIGKDEELKVYFVKMAANKGECFSNNLDVSLDVIMTRGEFGQSLFRT